MQSYDVYELEDNKNYLLLEKKVYKNIEYLLFCEENNYKNICIRKIEVDDGKRYIVSISEDEFDEVINLFNKID